MYSESNDRLSIQQRTLAHRLRTLVGYTWVPETHVRIVFREGRYHRALPAGYHFWGWRFRESLGELVMVGIRTTTVDHINCRSEDSIPFDVGARLAYTWNPIDCEREILVQLLEQQLTVLAGMISAKAANVISRVAGQYEASALSSGFSLEQLQARVKARFEREMRRFGVRCIDLSITQIRQSGTVEDLTQSAVGWRTFADKLQGVSDEASDQIYGAEQMKRFGAGGGQLRLSRRQESQGNESTEEDMSRGRRTGRRPDNHRR